MAEVAITTHGLLSAYERLRTGAWAGEPGWLGELREAGRSRFALFGLPSQRLETWKYTSLRPLEKVAFVPADVSGVAPGFAAPLPPALVPGSLRLVFVDGRFRPELSAESSGLPAGVTLGTLTAAVVDRPEFVRSHLGRTAVVDGHPMIALNTALHSDGTVLHLAKGAVMEQPVELLFYATATGEPAAWHPRVLIVAEPNSTATVVEHHAGQPDAVTFANTVVEISLGEGARLHHYKLQAEATTAFHISTTTAHLEKDSRYDNFVLTSGARLARNEIRAVLAGTGVTCRVNGAYMVRGRQHADTTTLIDHANPHCQSREVYQGVIDDYARAVFQGKILVRPDAQKTDGYQLNRALLLSDNAEIDSKPELEIYADDVKCSHGATTGDLDETALFYLRSRGIDRSTARALLIRSFLGEVLEEIEVEAVRSAFGGAVETWLEDR